jgi:hypothetical protein
MLVLTGASVAAVLVVVWARIATIGPEHANLRLPALVLSIAIPLGLAIFALAGPLQHGWARRAGTPTSLLAPRRADVTTGAFVASRAGR